MRNFLVKINVVYVPTIKPIRQFWFFQAHDIKVPVVSFKIAHTSILTSCKKIWNNYIHYNDSFIYS